MDEYLQEVVPEDISPSNKIASQDFVNSSVATNTATYQGAYNLVSDLNLTTAATHQQIEDKLETVIGYDAEHDTKWNGVDRNDYCFVMVPTSDATPTEIKQVDRYKVTETPDPFFPTGSKVKAWAYEYTLNNSGFTAAQWAAINSGLVEGSATLTPVYSQTPTFSNWSFANLPDSTTIELTYTAGEDLWFPDVTSDYWSFFGDGVHSSDGENALSLDIPLTH